MTVEGAVKKDSIFSELIRVCQNTKDKPQITDLTDFIRVNW